MFHVRWLEEIERKQAEMVAAQIALEKLRQRDRLLTTENEMFKVKNLLILAAFSWYIVVILFTVLYTIVLIS